MLYVITFSWTQQKENNLEDDFDCKDIQKKNFLKSSKYNKISFMISTLIK